MGVNVTSSNEGDAAGLLAINRLNSKLAAVDICIVLCLQLCRLQILSACESHDMKASQCLSEHSWPNNPANYEGN